MGKEAMTATQLLGSRCMWTPTVEIITTVSLFWSMKYLVVYKTLLALFVWYKKFWSFAKRKKNIHIIKKSQKSLRVERFERPTCGSGIRCATAAPHPLSDFSSLTSHLTHLPTRSFLFSRFSFITHSPLITNRTSVLNAPLSPITQQNNVFTS